MATSKNPQANSISVSADDAGWAMDAMRSRADAYERTVEYLKEGDFDDAPFEIEEVNDEAEARSIAKSYRDVIKRFETAIKG